MTSPVAVCQNDAALGERRHDPLPADSVGLALSLPDPRMVQRVLLMLVDDAPTVDPRVLAPLVRHPVLEVRMTAVAVLSRWKDPESQRVLAGFVTDPAALIRERVLTALESSRSVLTPVTATAALQVESDADLARRVAALLVQHDPVAAGRTLHRTVAALVSGRRPVAILSALLDVLRELDEGAWQRLMRHLRGHPRAEYAALADGVQVGDPPGGGV